MRAFLRCGGDPLPQRGGYGEIAAGKAGRRAPAPHQRGILTTGSSLRRCEASRCRSERPALPAIVPRVARTAGRWRLPHDETLVDSAAQCSDDGLVVESGQALNSREQLPEPVSVVRDDATSRSVPAHEEPEDISHPGSRVCSHDADLIDVAPGDRFHAPVQQMAADFVLIETDLLAFPGMVPETPREWREQENDAAKAKDPYDKLGCGSVSMNIGCHAQSRQQEGAGKQPKITS
jgi:hypothetical protein